MGTPFKRSITRIPSTISSNESEKSSGLCRTATASTLALGEKQSAEDTKSTATTTKNGTATDDADELKHTNTNEIIEEENENKDKSADMNDKTMKRLANENIATKLVEETAGQKINEQEKEIDKKDNIVEETGTDTNEQVTKKLEKTKKEESIVKEEQEQHKIKKVQEQENDDENDKNENEEDEKEKILQEKEENSLNEISQPEEKENISPDTEMREEKEKEEEEKEEIMKNAKNESDEIEKEIEREKDEAEAVNEIKDENTESETEDREDREAERKKRKRKSKKYKKEKETKGEEEKGSSAITETNEDKDEIKRACPENGSNEIETEIIAGKGIDCEERSRHTKRHHHLKKCELVDGEKEAKCEEDFPTKELASASEPPPPELDEENENETHDKHSLSDSEQTSKTSFRELSSEISRDGDKKSQKKSSRSSGKKHPFTAKELQLHENTVHDVDEPHERASKDTAKTKHRDRSIASKEEGGGSKKSIRAERMKKRKSAVDLLTLDAKHKNASTSTDRFSTLTVMKNAFGMSHISKEEKHDLILTEIYVSEEYYVKELRLIVEKLIQPLREMSNSKKPILTEQQITSLFSCPYLEIIFKYNVMLLSKLEQCVSSVKNKCDAATNPVTVGSVFLVMADFFKTYSTYSVQYVKMLKVYDTLVKESSAMTKFLNSVFQAEHENLDLLSLLIMPIQRILRYVLLLRELLKTTENDDPEHVKLEKALEKMEVIAQTINEYQHTAENQTKLSEIQSLITDAGDLVIVSPARTFLREGPLVVVDKCKFKRVHVFLFNNLLVMTKDGKDTYKYKGSIRITESTEVTDFTVTATAAIGASQKKPSKAEASKGKEKHEATPLDDDTSSTGKHKAFTISGSKHVARKEKSASNTDTSIFYGTDDADTEAWKKLILDSIETLKKRKTSFSK